MEKQHSISFIAFREFMDADAGLGSAKIFTKNAQTDQLLCTHTEEVVQTQTLRIKHDFEDSGR